MIYNVYRVAPYDVENFRASFKNDVWLWIETIEVPNTAELITHLNMGHEFLRYKINHDVVTTYHRDTEMRKFPCSIKLCPIIKPVTKPLLWCGIMG